MLHVRLAALPLLVQLTQTSSAALLYVSLHPQPSQACYFI